MKVVVTGGAGFIGANLCSRLAADPAINEVVALDDLSTGSKDNLAGLGATLIVGSILDAGLVAETLRDAAAVVHLAAVPSVPRSLTDPLRSHAVNATGTLQLLEAARAHGGLHVILASSSSVYGRNPELPKHEGLLTMPMSPYAVSKLATESYALAYAECFGLPVLPFRFFNVFGPLQAAGHAYAAVVPAFVSAALEGRPLPLYGDGSQTRDFTYVDTVTAVIADAVRRQVTSDGPVNLAFGTRTSLRELIALLSEVLGRELAVEQLPSRAGDVKDSQADNTRLRAMFPSVEPMPLRSGLEATTKWYADSLGSDQAS
jgi:UDP-glucose 4-epimerase